MNEFPFQKFIDLVAFDQATNKLEQEYTRLDQEIIKTKEEINRATSELEAAKSRLMASKKEVDSKELEMKSLDEKQKEKQRVLDRVTNHKESQSLYQEIENLKKLQHDFEEELLKAWHKLETSTREYTLKHEEIEKRRQNLEKQFQDYIHQQVVIKKTLEENQNERPAKKLGIPEEWLEKYAIMQRTVTNPVVPVINGSCSACFYNLPHQDILRLKRHALLQCKECYRFLYME
jgi:uncharacterized protein